MITFIFGTIFGGLLGIMMMCLVSVSKDKDYDNQERE